MTKSDGANSEAAAGAEREASPVWVANAPELPPRPRDSHKGDYGRILVIGGSVGMAGAAGLAGMAALRSGAGLVKLAVPASCLPIVAAFEPSYMTVPLPEDPQGRLSSLARERIGELVDEATCVAIGPGLGRSAALTELVEWLFQTCPRPLVVDADALNALASGQAWRGAVPAGAGPRILTPHPGEFRRLWGGPAASRVEQERQAITLARQTETVIVLKGAQTLVTDGRQAYHNSTGNPGMATGGSGDVLTGITAALLAQRLAGAAGGQAFGAACLATYWHGLAGDRAAARLGEVSLIASDLLRFLPSAIRGGWDEGDERPAK
jgi:NAD(P)H-hydrate epimerase